MTNTARRSSSRDPRPRPTRARSTTRLYDLVEARVRRLLTDNPIAGHVPRHPHRGPPPGRREPGRRARRDRRGAGPPRRRRGARPGRAVRRRRGSSGTSSSTTSASRLFDADEIRRWERRSTAAGELGDAVFLLFARGAAPLAERIERIADRLEGAPAFLEQVAARARRAARSRSGSGRRRATPRTCRACSPRCGRRPDGVLDGAALARLDRAIARRRTRPSRRTARWVAGTLADATDDWPLGAERYDELVRLRAFGDLDADAILEIGWDQLRTNLEARRAAARELDPDADLPTVIDRLKADHPATFEEALEGYRDAMRRARAYLIEHDIATIPDDETIEVIATPEYLRSVMPFAAYFSPARFDADQRGIYVVTPAVDNDPNAMLRALLRLDLEHQHPRGVPRPPPPARGRVAKHPSPHPDAHRRPRVRRGLGHVLRADDARGGLRRRARLPRRRCTRTRSGGRAGSSSTSACTAASSRPTRRPTSSSSTPAFEIANARAEVRRYTYTPGYQLSYLLGKVLILGLREDEQRRRGADFSLKAFHDTLLRNGSLPISFHRRLLRGEG